MAHAVFGDQMPGDQRTQRTRSTRDEHRRIRAEYRGFLFTRGAGPSKTRNEQRSTPDNQLRFTLSQHRRKQALEIGLFVDVHENDRTVWMLCLGRAHETPRRGM